jgi:Vitamin K-dependent gamma-carboxylase
VGRRLDHWIFDAYKSTPRSLAVSRILIGAYLVLWRFPDVRWMRSLPDAFYRPPPGPLRLTGGVPSSGALTALSVVLSVTTVALLVGYHTRLASCVTGLLLFTVDGFAYSFGHVHHSGTYLAAVLVIMAASGWGDAYSVDAVRRRDRAARTTTEAWPGALAALVLGFLMLTAVLPKLTSGWLDPATLAVRSHVVHYHFVAPNDGLLGSLPLGSTSALVWKPLDYLTVLFELGFAVAIVSPRRLRIFCAAAVAFHFAIFLAFGIDFTASVVAYSIFFPWSTAVDRVRIHRSLATLAGDLGAMLSRLRVALGLAVLLGGVALFLLRDRIGMPMRHLAPPVVSNPDQAATILLFAIALPVALAYILSRAASAAGRRVAQGNPSGSAALAPTLPAGPT